MSSELTRNNPVVSRTQMLVYLDAPYAPLGRDERVDKTRIALKGTDGIGTNYTLPCTPACFRQVTGYDAAGVKRTVPMHLGLDQARFLVRIDVNDKAFRVDRFLEQDRSRLDKKEDNPVLRVRVGSDEEGVLTMFEAPHNTSPDDQKAVLNEMSGRDKFRVGDTIAGFIVSAIHGDVVELATPGRAATSLPMM